MSPADTAAVDAAEEDADDDAEAYTAVAAVVRMYPINNPTIYASPVVIYEGHITLFWDGYNVHIDDLRVPGGVWDRHIWIYICDIRSRNVVWVVWRCLRLRTWSET